MTSPKKKEPPAPLKIKVNVIEKPKSALMRKPDFAGSLRGSSKSPEKVKIIKKEVPVVVKKKIDPNYEKNKIIDEINKGFAQYASKKLAVDKNIVNDGYQEEIIRKMLKEKVEEKMKELAIEKARESEKAMWAIPPKIGKGKNKGFRMNNLFFIPTNERVDYGAILARK